LFILNTVCPFGKGPKAVPYKAPSGPSINGEPGPLEGSSGNPNSSAPDYSRLLELAAPRISTNLE